MGMRAQAEVFYGIVFEGTPELPNLTDGEQEEYDIDPGEYLIERLEDLPAYDTAGIGYTQLDSGELALCIAYEQQYGTGYERITLDTDTAAMDVKLDSALAALGIEKPAEGYGWYLAAAFN